MSHTPAKEDDEQAALKYNLRTGVRDKIRWMPEQCKWILKFKGEIGDDLKYCKANGITLAIANNLESKEFMVAREESFLNALRVWNAIDRSGRKRIAIPERRLNVQMVPVQTSEAMSHTDNTDSDRESENDDADE